MGNSHSHPAPSGTPILATNVSFTELPTLATNVSFTGLPTLAARSFSVTPFEPTTLTSITKASSKRSSSHRAYSTSPTETETYCFFDEEESTSSCSTWVFTVDVPTPFSASTPTGGYDQTSESSYSFPSYTPYTCTDFSCIISVAEDYGYSLCIETATSTSDSWYPTETWKWTEEPTMTTTDDWPTVPWPAATETCDPVFDWQNCGEATTEEPWETISDSWTTWTEDPWLLTTSSDCDTSTATTTSSKHRWTSADFTVPGSESTPSATIVSYTTYSDSSSRSRTTRRPRTSTTSECDFFFDEDCVTSETGRYTTDEFGTPFGARKPSAIPAA